MTLPLKKAVDSLFNRCGTIGNYQGREVLFLLIEPDEVVGVGFVKAHSDTHFMKIRISDAPDLAVGDTIETDAATYRVHTEPVKDIHNLVWSVDVLCN